MKIASIVDTSEGKQVMVYGPDPRGENVIFLDWFWADELGLDDDGGVDVLIENWWRRNGNDPNYPWPGAA